MREEPPPESLDILCIGEIKSGKSFFLENFTQDPIPKDNQIPYSIYAKAINHSLIYFHELSEEEPLYLEKEYDGVLFFVDFVDTWYAVENILKWMELLSKITGTNIFHIPIRVIITKTDLHINLVKWKKTLENQLSSVVSPHQIIYFENVKKVEEPLAQFLSEIKDSQAEGIKSTNQNHIKLYGLKEIIKTYSTNIRLTFFRWRQLFEKYIQEKLEIYGSMKSI